MRYVRLTVLAVLAVVLLVLASANRQGVVLHLLPADLATYLGRDWQIELPLFLIILVAAAAGVVVGFFWEWLRESRHRTTASRQTREAGRLAREVERLRDKHGEAQDEVVALLDRARRTG